MLSNGFKGNCSTQRPYSTNRRDRIINGVKLKLTKVNKDRAENQRRTE